MADCPVCRSPATPRFVLDDRQFVACAGDRCNLVFVHPQPSPEQLDAYYKEDYFDSGTSIYKLATSTLSSQILGYLLEASGKDTPTILDYGCATGRLWEVLRPPLQRGYVGLEPSPIARRNAAQRTGRPIVGAVTELRDIAGFSWDICIMNQVLEHLRDPLEDLTELGRSAPSGALLWIATPNRRSVHALRLGKSWRHYANRTHLYFFDHKSCELLLARAGFGELQRATFALKYAYKNPLRRVAHRLARRLMLSENLTLTARMCEHEPGTADVT